MPAEKLPHPPKPDAADARHRVEAAIAQANPVTGVVAAVYGLLTPPLERRRTEWFEQLWEAMTELQNRLGDFDISQLADDEQFVTAVLHATAVAVRTHQEEKHEALRNAVLNVGAGTAPDDDVQMMFLDAVDSLPASHVRFLSALAQARLTPDAEAKVREAVKGSLRRRLEAAPGAPSYTREWVLVDTKERPLYVDPYCSRPQVLYHMWPPVLTDILGWQLLQILKDLEGRGFVDVHPSLDKFTQVTATRAFAGVTDQGREFLDFITSPLEKSSVSA